MTDTPSNSDCFFLGQAFRLLQRERPRVKAVVSYSDPMPRRCAQGKLLTPGHVGIIYQAHNGRYVGRSAARTLHVGPDGRVLSPRTLSKIRLGERGWQAAQLALENMGAPERRVRGPGAEWVERVLSSGMFRAVKHGGNHCYLWPLKTGLLRRRIEDRFRPRLPYPRLN